MISIIIPMFNEEDQLDALLTTLDREAQEAEVIFVDGGSYDKSLEKVKEKYRALQSPKKGRAAQMNYGASLCSGEILFFLHADSQLPEGALTQIQEVMRESELGAFGLAFDDKSVLMKINAYMSNLRIKKRNIAFGDQGIFITKLKFFEIGGFREIPLMEDYQFSLDAKKAGLRYKLCKHPLSTSARRYPKGSLAKLLYMSKLWFLQIAFRLGVNPQKISQWY
ncbi:MAG: TIGR04283 family arsenosugar biosynthesis glycosyltransferase [Coriobacteriia bacterium]|nr:TIGR04283 family arsenosugar biosynthesis glycosyltransferase [Coriobacteriia bacterium]